MSYLPTAPPAANSEDGDDVEEDKPAQTLEERLRVIRGESPTSYREGNDEKSVDIKGISGKNIKGNSENIDGGSDTEVNLKFIFELNFIA